MRTLMLRVHRKLARVCVGVAWLAALLQLAPASALLAQNAAPAGADRISVSSAQKLELPGVGNFGRVTPTLYRGGQPKAQGFQELRKHGVEIVVNFRDERGKIESERRIVEAQGMRSVSIAFPTSDDPTQEQVAEFLQLLRANPQKKIFVHCHLGADRTGAMVAVYRMAAENWTPQQALQEMHTFHYHHFWWPHFQRYVEGFPALLAADPKLRAVFATPATASAP